MVDVKTPSNDITATDMNVAADEKDIAVIEKKIRAIATILGNKHKVDLTPVRIKFNNVGGVVVFKCLFPRTLEAFENELKEQIHPKMSFQGLTNGLRMHFNESNSHDIAENIRKTQEAAVANKNAFPPSAANGQRVGPQPT